MDNCVNSEISRHYVSWINKATGLTHDKTRAKDLVHEVLTRLLDRPEQDVVDIVCRGKVRQYVDRALWLSWHSNRSDYAMRYRKYYELITEATGKIVLSGKINSIAHQISLDNLSAGVYQISLYSVDEILTRTIIKLD